MAGQIPVFQGLPVQSGSLEPQFPVQPVQFVRQQGLPQLSGPGVAQASAVQGAALNPNAMAFQPIAVNQAVPIQRAASDPSGAIQHGAAQADRTAAGATAPALDGAAQAGGSQPARAISPVSDPGDAETEDGEIKDGEDAC